MSQGEQTTCSCCQLEKSNLRNYPEMGMLLCAYCELLPQSELKQKQQNPQQDGVFSVMSRLFGKLETRVLQQDPDIPLRLPVHDKALALVMHLATTKMCPACKNINTCHCNTGPKPDYEWEAPEFWPYQEARDIVSALEQPSKTKLT